MRPQSRTPTHPGEILLEEFLVPMGLSQSAFAAHIGVSAQRVHQIVRGRRGVSAETAWLFAQAFGTTPDFWLNLQAAHDLVARRPARRVRRLARGVGSRARSA